MSQPVPSVGTPVPVDVPSWYRRCVAERSMDDPEVRRGLLQALAHGDSQTTYAKSIGVHRKTVQRYVRDNATFRANVERARKIGRLARTMSAAEHAEAVDELLALEPLAPDLAEARIAVGPTAIPAPLALAKNVIEPEVVGASDPTANTDTKPDGAYSDQGFTELSWRLINDPDTHPAIHVAHVKALSELRKSRQRSATLLHLGNVAAQARSATPSRGLTEEAKRQTIHQIIGPPPDDEGSEPDDGSGGLGVA